MGLCWQILQKAISIFPMRFYTVHAKLLICTFLPFIGAQLSLLIWVELVVCFFNYNALDEMGSRIDELEQSINELRTEMGQEGSPSPSAALKPKEEPRTADDSA